MAMYWSLWDWEDLFNDPLLKLKSKSPVFPDMLRQSPNDYPDLRHTTPFHIRKARSGEGIKECTENGCSTV